MLRSFQLVQKGTHLVDIDPRPHPHIARLDPKRRDRRALFAHAKTSPQAGIDGIPEWPTGLVGFGLQLRGNVIIKG